MAPPLRETRGRRSADVRSVLDLLRAALPAPLHAALEWSRTGAFGQSAGGFTALQAAHGDQRIAAAATFDGVTAYVQEDGVHGYLPPLGGDGLRRPFLLVGKDGNTRRTVRSWDALWRRSAGPRTGLSVRGAAHGTYGRRGGGPPAARPAAAAAVRDRRGEHRRRRAPGRPSPRPAPTAQPSSDRALRDRDDRGLLERPSPRDPQVRLSGCPADRPRPVSAPGAPRPVTVRAAPRWAGPRPRGCRSSRRRGRPA
ncbi:hypothetical protein V2S66_32090 [Streptomyces sp. V4-01]|uniref:Uncharacterized protein n=1 Tax=Actinacidiphila polyblastidii TaxID=3110430 RepID=A0ABU7PL81_9ACTN|nr:hypothetical protein [Streptomyces sp. V4-01]